MSVDGFDVVPVTSSLTIQLAVMAPDTQSALVHILPGRQREPIPLRLGGKALRKILLGPPASTSGQVSPTAETRCRSSAAGTRTSTARSVGRISGSSTKGPENDVSPNLSRTARDPWSRHEQAIRRST